MPQRRFWCVPFTLDLRSLALFRIALGLLLLADLTLRLTDFTAHYTNFGVWPSDLLVDLSRANRLCFHNWSGSAGWAGSLFVIHFLAASAFLVGFHTRLATFICWIFLVSLQNRNGLINSGADSVVRLLFFWAMFLPVHVRFSWDARKRKTTFPIDYFGGASMGLVFQIVLIYLTSVAIKLVGDEWYPDGTALYYVFNADTFAGPVGIWFRPFLKLLAGVTFGVIVIEVLAPLLILSPFFFIRARMAGIVMLALLQIGFCSMLRLGLFPFVNLVALIALIPSEIWGHFLVDKNEGEFRPFGIIQDWLDSAALVGFVLVALYLGATLDRKLMEFPKILFPLVRFIRVDQSWSLFAPHPLATDEWATFEGVAKNGSVNLVTGKRWTPANSVEPDSLDSEYENVRWRKYFIALFKKKYDLRVKEALGNYLCYSWNHHHPTAPVSEVKVHFISERTLPPGRPVVKNTSLFAEHQCKEEGAPSAALIANRATH